MGYFSILVHPICTPLFMATNRHAVIRYHALDDCFRNHAKKHYVEDLLEACYKALQEFSGGEKGIQRRQLFDDIRFMKSEIGYRIELDKIRDGQRYFYRYKDSKFTIRSSGLNNEEAVQIKAALQVLSRFSGLPQFAWVEETTTRLESRFHLKKGADKIIAFDENKNYVAIQKIGPLYNAILKKQVLKIKYQNYKHGLPKEMVFHPYFLKQYNNRWFCFGLCEGHNPPTNLALDRIIDIENYSLSYIPNLSIDFETYFNNVVGVTIKGDLQKIRIKISKAHWPYLKSKPLHRSQTVDLEGEEFVIISIEVKPNYELESLLMSHGNDLEVMEPKSFKEALLARIKPRNV